MSQPGLHPAVPVAFADCTGSLHRNRPTAQRPSRRSPFHVVVKHVIRPNAWALASIAFRRSADLRKIRRKYYQRSVRYPTDVAIFSRFNVRFPSARNILRIARRSGTAAGLFAAPFTLEQSVLRFPVPKGRSILTATEYRELAACYRSRAGQLGMSRKKSVLLGTSLEARLVWRASLLSDTEREDPS